jgi:Cu/Ag efflux protein CusF
MARKSRIIAVCLALAFIWSCGGNNSNQKQAAPAPVSGPAAAVQSNQYKAAGVVKALDPKGPAIEIDHGDVEGLMPAMQMEFPVTDPNLLNGLAVNDQIDFTIESATDGMKVVAIKKK